MYAIELMIPKGKATVTVEAEGMANQVAAVFAAMVRPCQDAPSLCGIEVMGSGPYQVRYSGQDAPCASQRDVIFLVHWIIEQIVDTIRWNSYIVFHGGLIAKDGQAYGLVAPTRTGKSTLTAFLSAEDYHFYADDYIFVNRETGRVAPFALPLVLRNLLPELRNEVLIEGDNPRRKEYSYFVKTAEPPAGGDYPKLACMLFLKRGGRNEIVPLSKGESYIALLRNLKSPMGLEREILFLKEFCHRVQCFSLHYRDLAYAKEAIEEIQSL